MKEAVKAEKKTFRIKIKKKVMMKVKCLREETETQYKDLEINIKSTSKNLISWNKNLAELLSWCNSSPSDV